MFYIRLNNGTYLPLIKRRNNEGMDYIYEEKQLTVMHINHKNFKITILQPKYQVFYKKYWWWPFESEKRVETGDLFTHEFIKLQSLW